MKQWKVEKEVAMLMEEFRERKSAMLNWQFCSLKKVLMPHFWFRSPSSLSALPALFRACQFRSAPCKVESPACLLCQDITMESVKHFLLNCPYYRQQHHILQRKLCWNAGSLSFLLNSPVAVLPLLKFVHSTGWFKAFFKGPGSSYKCMSVRTSQIRPQIHYNFSLQSAMSDRGVTCHSCDLCQNVTIVQKKFLWAPVGLTVVI